MTIKEIKQSIQVLNMKLWKEELKEKEEKTDSHE